MTLELLSGSVKCQSGHWNSSLGQLSASQDTGTPLWVLTPTVLIQTISSLSFRTEFFSFFFCPNSIHIRYVLIVGAAVDLQESCQ